MGLSATKDLPATIAVAGNGSAAPTGAARHRLRRGRSIGALRIAFGVVWAFDASFKWAPSFINKFSDYLTGAKDGQPQIVKSWIDFWVKTVNVDPHVFAHVVAVAETLVAIGLILGAFSNLTYIVGGALSAVIWATAEGFGGPYKPGSTDIGAASIYVFVFAALFLLAAGRYWGLDTKLRGRLGRLGWLTT